MVRQRRPPPARHGGPPEFQKFRDGGIFPKGVARFWDPSCDGWQCSTEHGTGSPPYRCGSGSGLNVLGVAGDASCAVVLRCLFGVGIILELFEAPYGWSWCRACDMHCFQDGFPIKSSAIGGPVNSGFALKLARLLGNLGIARLWHLWWPRFNIGRVRVGIGDSERRALGRERRHPLAKCAARLHAKPWLPLSGMRLQSLALGLWGIADASLWAPCLAVPAWLQLIRSHAWSASLSHWVVGCWLARFGCTLMVYELWYGCVCLRLALRIESLGAAPSRFATGPCVSRAPGFLCCIPNVMELVANGVPFLSRGSQGHGRTPVAHAAPAPLKIILWPPRSSRCLLAPRCEHGRAFMAFQRPKIALSLVLHALPRLLGPSPQRALAHAASHRWRMLPVDPARVICLSQRLSHACWPTMVVTGDGELGSIPRGARETATTSKEGKPRNYPIPTRELELDLDGATVRLVCTAVTPLLPACAPALIDRSRPPAFGAQDDRYRPSLNYKRCRTVDRADVAYRTHAPYEKSKSWVPGSMVARLKLKGIDGRAPLSGARA
ncbi:hypothetical protein FNV43_RR20895 [Rhamnella rubrinervis]|uniref:Uncharacterized protein n=1 Tax=Rhamnella rubrinervis TaxID=2594499 RepID=A0A8K0E214_9ROSA|nr:hypothetical protein FNV43_RR20895 [Rhamnella rubrinervis]